VRDTKRMTDKLEVFGFSINYEKSVLQPSQRVIFFGVIIATVQFKVFLSQEKIDKIKTSCKTVSLYYHQDVGIINRFDNTCL
jgi:hypothetical protein